MNFSSSEIIARATLPTLEDGFECQGQFEVDGLSGSLSFNPFLRAQGSGGERFGTLLSLPAEAEPRTHISSSHINSGCLWSTTLSVCSREYSLATKCSYSDITKTKPIWSAPPPSRLHAVTRSPKHINVQHASTMVPSARDVACLVERASLAHMRP